ncbi:hypothetical protein INT48_004196 [Thamnidium elegans]|uniref:SWR1-complex protein 4 n=1 Tax=Thamnidium elegans TaxID=101142 RepID=A0A8H7SL04_9FUNG|nr:hypothetical protein INT48_004196 [Thamnidium elegans]
MSGSDIRDILQIGSPSESSPKRSKPSVEKRPDGISRELYSLIGGAPPVAFVKPTFKAKFKTKKKATPWVLTPFLNPARTDGLVLQHWLKAEEAEDQEYPFAKFNKVIDIIEYTEDDYEKYLTDTDWSKEETDYLFELCRQYDLRFPVIEDRYEFENKTRTMEDLKDRYYSVYRKLILQGRGPISNDYIPDRQALVQQYAYDKNKEVERKNALIMLMNRTKEQVEEEEALFVEAKRIELNESRLARERESLLNSLQLEQIQQIPSTPSTPLHGNSPTSAGGVLSSPGGIGITGGTAGGTHSSELKKKKKSIHDDKKGQSHEHKKEKLTPGVYIRSQKLPIVKPTMQAKVLKVLEEMGIGPRPIMPTNHVCQKFEFLQNSILNMFELKKIVDKTEAEHKVKIQKGRDGTPTGRKRSSSNAGSTNGNREKRRKPSSPLMQLQDSSHSSSTASSSSISTFSSFSNNNNGRVQPTIINPSNFAYFQNNWASLKSTNTVGVNPHRFLQRPRRMSTKIVAKIKHGTIMNGKGEFVNKGSAEDQNSWLDEARANRKIADLEIEKASLLVLNTTLETKLRQQTSQIAELQKRLQMNEGPLTPVSDKHVDESLLFDDDETTIVSSTEDDDIETDQVFQRIKSMLEGLILQAEVALLQKTKQSGKVLQQDQYFLTREEEKKRNVEDTLHKLTVRTSPIISPSSTNTRKPPTRRVSDTSKPSSAKMSRNLSRKSSPPVMVSTSPRPFSPPPTQRSASPRYSSLLRKAQDLDKPKWV